MTQPVEQAERGPSLIDGFVHEPLRARVADVLRSAILDGTLRPGMPLIEKTIAEDLDISRAPVREAIRTLAQEGLVASVPYKGSHVRRLTARDVAEIYSLRGLLERFALRSVLEAAAGRVEAGGIARLRAVCDDMEACAAVDDLRGLSREDERFHRTLIELADHELLLDMWAHIALRARHVMGLRNAQLRDPRRVAANHRAIVDALEAGDLPRSLQLLTEHVEAGAQLLLEDWQEPT